MSRRSATLGLALALCVAPAVGLAQPQTPPAAPPAADGAGAQRTEESRIARMIKSATREGIERHELDRAMAMYAPDGVWVLGRRAEPDEHDVRLDLAKRRAQLALRFDNPLTGQEQVFFRDVQVEIEGDEATMTATVAMDLFTGHEELKHRYRLVRTGDGWRVAELRVWPIMRSQVGMPTFYTDDYWLEAEKNVEKTLADTTAPPAARLAAYTRAGYLLRGYAEARALTKASPDDPLAWRSRALFALEVGEAADALESGRKAVTLSPEIGLPPTLDPLIRKGKGGP